MVLCLLMIFEVLKWSNTELRKQLENQVITIENRLAVERHENEKKELRESVARPYLDQLSELQRGLEINRRWQKPIEYMQKQSMLLKTLMKGSVLLFSHVLKQMK